MTFRIFLTTVVNSWLFMLRFFIQNRFLNQTDNYAFVLRELVRAGLADRIQRTEKIENQMTK